MPTMKPFAFILPDRMVPPLLGFSDALFEVFIVVSFVCVAMYAIRQVRDGQLINNGRSPLPVKMPGYAGWPFIGCVVELIFLQSLLFVCVVFAGIVGLLIGSRHTVEEQFGFTRLSFTRLLSASLLIFGAVMLMETPLTSAVAWIMDAVHLPHPEQESVKDFSQMKQPVMILAFFVQASVLSPMVEEFFFRGFLQTYLKNYTSTWMALVLSSGVFAFAHVSLGAALPLWLLGLVLGLAYEHTGCLLLPIGIHSCWNFITALNILLDRGTN